MKALSNWIIYKKPEIIAINYPILIIIPIFLILFLSKRVLAFTFAKDKTSFPITGIIFISLVSISYLFYMTIGILGATISIWIIGAPFAIMFINSLGPGLIFIKPRCVGCALKTIIVEHERLHLQGIIDEEEVWSIIKKKYDLSEMIRASSMKHCNKCPIPIRMKENLCEYNG